MRDFLRDVRDAFREGMVSFGEALRPWITKRLTPDRGRWWWMSLVLFALQVLLVAYWILLVGNGYNDWWQFAILGFTVAGVGLTMYTGYLRQAKLTAPPPPTSSIVYALDTQGYVQSLSFAPIPVGCQRCGHLHVTIADAYVWHEERAKWLGSLAMGATIHSYSVSFWVHRDREFMLPLSYVLTKNQIETARHVHRLSRMVSFTGWRP